MTCIALSLFLQNDLILHTLISKQDSLSDDEHPGASTHLVRHAAGTTAQRLVQALEDLHTVQQMSHPGASTVKPTKKPSRLSKPICEGGLAQYFILEAGRRAAMLEQQRTPGAGTAAGSLPSAMDPTAEDLLPPVWDRTWTLHGSWMAAPDEDLDTSEFDALLAGPHCPDEHGDGDRTMVSSSSGAADDAQHQLSMPLSIMVPKGLFPTGFPPSWLDGGNRVDSEPVTHIATNTDTATEKVTYARTLMMQLPPVGPRE